MIQLTEIMHKSPVNASLFYANSCNVCNHYFCRVLSIYYAKHMYSLFCADVAVFNVVHLHADC